MGEAPDDSQGSPAAGGSTDTGAARSTGKGTGAAVTAQGLGLDGPRGPVFGGVGIDAPPGSLVALEGPSGSGRTCLLLTLTGRMKATAGHAQIGGRPLPGQLAAVRRISALCAVPGVTDLEPALSVAEQLREQVLLQRRFDGSLRSLIQPRSRRAAASRARLEAALSAAGLDLDALPKGPRTRVRDLERLETLRLSVALALLGEPRLLAVDDVDLKLSDEEREQAWSLLRSVAEAGTTVLAVCSKAPGDALVVRTREGQGRRGTPGPQRTRTEESAQTTKGEAADALAEAGRA
ncbi:ATP-binding cassette domain-containing protein [Streptomyces albidus (ex Kaewkla and Franco 2022)]|uniref:ATP-binding cassette domain-containing protein n=1 Tax=Streptomyces albidus (ex Kaewkla and Franco 2022) TaxID=722709 RepID=UPI0015EF17A5|nr:ATP-binding cassette domain-containing protein [Streptomyces albidus (ex Kaewkla and Franco 2022)]